MTFPTYRMSEAGGCIKSLAAQRLGYETSSPRTQDDESRLEYYSMCEDLAAYQLMKRGLVLEGGDVCDKCQGRRGAHVEVSTDLFNLVGHLDRRLITTTAKYPIEIKSLGRFTWEGFRKHQFNEFPDYAGQEACYLQAEGKPGIYWVMNRDTGQCLGYIVNDFGNELNLKGFEKIVLPVTFNIIVQRLNEVEIFVGANQLPDAIYDTSNPQCRYCGFKYLCRSEKQPTEMTTQRLIDASELYKEGKRLDSLSKDNISQANAVWLEHIMSKGLKKGDKFAAAGVSISYGGLTTRKYVDEKKLAELVSKDILTQVYKETRAWEDIRPRITER